MLERTAGCLESGSLRRLLPTSRTSVKSCRRLHSGFWNHGASGELSPLWTVLLRGAESMEPQHKQKAPIGSGISNSHTVLLDFLYPTEALNMIRNYSSWGCEKHDNWTRSWRGKTGHRQYTSSAKDNGSDPEGATVEDTQKVLGSKALHTDINVLYRKFELERQDDYADAWKRYSLLDESEQILYRALMIAYLGTSPRVVDSERVTELYGSLDDTQKSITTYRHTIGAFLKLRNVADAMETFRSGVRILGIPAGSEILFLHFIRGWDWLTAASLWEEVQGINEQNKNDVAEIYNIYAAFDTLPEIADHVLQLQKYTTDVLLESAKVLQSTQDENYKHEHETSPYMTGVEINLEGVNSHNHATGGDISIIPGSEKVSEGEHEVIEDQMLVETLDARKEALEIDTLDDSYVDAANSIQVPADSRNEKSQTTNYAQPNDASTDLDNEDTVEIDSEYASPITLTGTSTNSEDESSLGDTSEASKPVLADAESYAADRVLTENSQLIQFAVTIIRRYLYRDEFFVGQQFVSLLSSLRSWTLLSGSDFARALNHLFMLNEEHLVPVCYYMAREAEDYWLDQRLLQQILHVFVSNSNIEGIRRIIEDFFSLHNGPTPAAYRLCMKAFSILGDEQTVIALFDQFSARYRRPASDTRRAASSLKQLTSSDFAPILHVYARRGEIKEVQRVINEMQHLHGLKPDIVCLNILLNTYARIQNYEKASDCFGEILNHPNLMPDKYTLGTMMRLSAKHGDFQDLIEIVELAEELEVVMDTNYTLECVVQAHLRHGQLEEAEAICEEAQAAAKFNGQTTRMWNKLLAYHAIRLDVDTVNRLLEKMNKLKVKFNRATYGCFMLAVSIVGLPERAWRVMSTIMPNAGMTPTRAHYGLVMGAFLTVGRHDEVLRVEEEMFKAGFKSSAASNLLVMKSSVRHDQQLNRALEIFVSTMTTMDPQDILDMPRKGDAQQPIDIAYPTMYYNYMIYILGISKNFGPANELYEAYRKIMPLGQRDPISICTAVMTVAAGQKDWAKVEKYWDLAFSEAVQNSKPLPIRKTIRKYRESNPAPGADAPKQLDVDEAAEERTVSPNNQFALAKALHIYMNALLAQDNAKKIVLTVSAVQNAGFALDYRNWNQYISEIAARWQYPKDAFLLCEKWLMPGWLGWPKLQRTGFKDWSSQLKRVTTTQFFKLRPFDLGTQRKLRRNDYLRPRTSTLLELRQAYEDLELLAIEDTQAEAALKEVKEKCMLTMMALQKVPLSARPGVEIRRNQYLRDRKLFPEE